MAEMNFGGVIETVVTSKEFSLEKAREVLKDETIAVIGYGIQGPGQACNLRDNGFNVIVGQREGKTYDKAVADGWVPGKTLFSIEEAAQKGTIVCMLLSDAGQIAVWPRIKQYLTPGKTLYYSHGFAINWSDRTGVVPPKDIDVILVAPKGSGTSLRTMFCEGRGLNCSYAVYQDASGKAEEKTIAFGIGIGAAIAGFKELQKEADAFKNTVAGANMEMATAAYIDTYKQILRDFNGDVGKSIAETQKRDAATIEKNESRIAEITAADQYHYGNVPVINGRGFEIKVHSDEDVKQLLNEYEKAGIAGREEFFRKWASFNTYRKVVLH